MVTTSLSGWEVDMNSFKQKAIIFLLFFMLNALYAGNFTFSYNETSFYIVKTKTNSKLYVNGNDWGDIKNKELTLFSKTDSDDKTFHFEGISFFLSNAFSNGKIMKIDDHKKIKLKKDKYGNNHNKFISYSSDLISFPDDNDLNPGDQWSKFSNITFKLSNTNRDITIKAPVHFRFTGYNNDKSLAYFTGFITHVQTKKSGTLKFHKIHKVIINETFHITYNTKTHFTKTIEQTFDHTIILNDLTVYENAGQSNTNYFFKPEFDDEDIQLLENNEILSYKLFYDKSIQLTLTNLYFDKNSFFLTKESKKYLDKIAVLLKKFRNNEIMITGHTAFAGTEKERLNLSEIRAKTVADYLKLTHGFSEETLSYVGKGATELISDEQTEEAMAENRRVEILILPK